MKKIVFSGLTASILMTAGAAFADDSATSLTTKNYVDTGLKYVYDVAATKADADSVYTKTQADQTFLTTADIANIDGQAYTGINGVAVNDHQVGLNINPVQGSMYVYTSAGWSALEVENTWNPGFLTGNTEEDENNEDEGE